MYERHERHERRTPSSVPCTTSQCMRTHLYFFSPRAEASWVGNILDDTVACEDCAYRQLTPALLLLIVVLVVPTHCRPELFSQLTEHTDVLLLEP